MPPVDIEDQPSAFGEQPTCAMAMIEGLSDVERKPPRQLERSWRRARSLPGPSPIDEERAPDDSDDRGSAAKRDRRHHSQSSGRGGGADPTQWCLPAGRDRADEHAPPL